MMYNQFFIMNKDGWNANGIAKIEPPNNNREYYTVFLKKGSVLYLQEVVSNCGTLMFHGVQLISLSTHIQDIIKPMVWIARTGEYSALLTTVVIPRSKSEWNSVIMETRIQQLKDVGFKALAGSRVKNKRSGNTLQVMLLDIDKYKEPV